VLVSLALGITCLSFGLTCRNAELRANHTDTCKDIHNDDSARALQAFGWIFSIPWIVALCVAAFIVAGVIIGAPFVFVLFVWKTVQERC